MPAATANIDFQTDQRIQTMIRQHPVFKQATILTVAHRLATIRDSDLIVVLDEGRVVEVGTPDGLLERQDSVFADMVRSGDLQNTEITSEVVPS